MGLLYLVQDVREYKKKSRVIQEQDFLCVLSTY
jgi:hypothetical protein